MQEKFRKLYHNITVCFLCSLMGKSRTKQKSLISTPFFPSPLLILPLWLVPFFFPSSLSCRVRVQLGDKGIETGSSVLLCQTIWLYTAVISPLYLSPGTGLCDELEQESSLRARVFVCVCVCVCVCTEMFSIWISGSCVAQLYVRLSIEAPMHTHHSCSPLFLQLPAFSSRVTSHTVSLLLTIQTCFSPNEWTCTCIQIPQESVVWSSYLVNEFHCQSTIYTEVMNAAVVQSKRTSAEKTLLMSSWHGSQLSCFLLQTLRLLLRQP